MYKSTLKCDDRIGNYLREISNSSGIDMSKLIRLALATAPFNDEFKRKVKENALGVPHVIMPQPEWNIDHDNIWINRQIEDLNAKSELDTILDRMNDKKQKTYPVDISEFIVEEEFDMGDIVIRVGNSHIMPH